MGSLLSVLRTRPSGTGVPSTTTHEEVVVPLRLCMLPDELYCTATRQLERAWQRRVAACYVFPVEGGLLAKTSVATASNAKRAFSVLKDGTVVQIRLDPAAAGYTASIVRTLKLASQTEGCVGSMTAVIAPPAAIRVEEFVNYFTYDDRAPDDDAPLSISMEAAPSPWGGPKDRYLMRVGLQGKRISAG